MDHSRFEDVDAVLFDLDGTLVDTLGDLHAAIGILLGELGLPPVAVAGVRGMIGTGERDLLTQVLQAVAPGGLPAVQTERAHARFLDIYARCNGGSSRLYPGADTALARLREARYPLALVSNKPTRFIAPLLLRSGISGMFAAIVGGDTTPHRKPEPEPLLHACALLRIAPRRALMIGDSPIDVAAARSAGCQVACVLHGYPLGADMAGLGVPVVPTLGRLPDMLPPQPAFPPAPSSGRRSWL